MKKSTSGGGWPAIWYCLNKARQAGFWRTWKALRSKNTCKTCAVGMGGQKGGMVNERGSFPEFCKKSVQAIAADLQDPIPDEFWEQHPISHLQSMSPWQLERCGRLATPVVREPGSERFTTISWEDALDRVAKRLQATDPEQSFWYFSGRSSNEAGFLLQLFARMYGTNNINNCSYYCHQASGVGLTSSIGSGTATIVLDDLHQADLVFVIGGNPASNHPRLMSALRHIRRRGGEVAVINPVVETGLVSFRVPSNVRSLLFGSRIASKYVQPHIGGDLALLTGIAKRIDELDAVDREFLAAHCDNSDAWIEHLRRLDWDEIQAKAGVEREQIDDLAECYASARNVVFSWTMGITHHAHGVENVQAISNLALMRGMVGRPQAGLLPIRGHSNVQGIGSVGVTPQLKQAVFDRVQNHFGVSLPTTPGLDTLACVEAAKAGRLKLGVCLGGNLYGSNPDASFAREALSSLSTMVYLNTTLNTGHAWGLADETLILPVLARDEEPQATTQESMFNFVRLSEGGPQRLSGPRSEVHVVAEIARRVLGVDGPVDWQKMAQTQTIRQAMGDVLPGFEKIADIDQTREEFQIGGRTFHEPGFPTESGKAQIHVHSLPDLAGDAKRLRLMTVRSEGQFNTVVYEEQDIYRGQSRRDVILLHPYDIKRLELQQGQPVTVRNETGELYPILVQSFPQIRPGNALMYYPEANVLVPRSSDPQSRTPAFKGALVIIEPVNEAVGGTS